MGCTAKLSSSRNQLLIFAYLTVCNFAILDLHLFTQLKKPKGIDFVESFNHEKDKDLTLMKQDIKYPLWCIFIIGHKYPEILVEPQLKSVSGCHFTLTKTVFFLKKLHDLFGIFVLQINRVIFAYILQVRDHEKLVQMMIYFILICVIFF